MRRSYQTVEFYTTLVTALIPWMNQQFGWNLSTETILAMITPIMTWVLARVAQKTIKGE